MKPIWELLVHFITTYIRAIVLNCILKNEFKAFLFEPISPLEESSFRSLTTPAYSWYVAIDLE